MESITYSSVIILIRRLHRLHRFADYPDEIKATKISLGRLGRHRLQ